MKIEIRSKKGITMVSLVVTIIILIILAGISINITLGDNGLITIAKKAKENMELEQIEKQSKLNELYTQIEINDSLLGNTNFDFIERINEFKKKIAEYIEQAGGIKPEYTASVETFGERILGIVKEVTKDATALPEDITIGKTAYVNGEKITGTRPNLEDLTQATATKDKILKDYTAYVNGKLIVGTMIDRGAVNQTLNAGGSYTIPEGYHNGQGKITANSLASQTGGTAIAGDILSGKTAYVNGNKVTGTMVNQGAKTATLNAGQSYTIPAGYHNGQGKITANSLASQTGGTATPDKILKDYTAYVNGQYIIGTMSNHGAVNVALNAGQSYTILPGYHNGSGRITANSLASQTPGTATADKIVSGETAWVNGNKITGTAKVAKGINASTTTSPFTVPCDQTIAVYGFAYSHQTGSGYSKTVTILKNSQTVDTQTTTGGKPVIVSNVIECKKGDIITFTATTSKSNIYNVASSILYYYDPTK